MSVRYNAALGPAMPEQYESSNLLLRENRHQSATGPNCVRTELLSWGVSRAASRRSAAFPGLQRGEREKGARGRPEPPGRAVGGEGSLCTSVSGCTSTCVCTSGYPLHKDMFARLRIFARACVFARVCTFAQARVFARGRCRHEPRPQGGRGAAPPCSLC